MGTWLNSDGLYIRYGADEADLAKGGQYSRLGSLEEIEIILDYTDVLSATAVLPQGSDSYGIVVPKGARLEEIETIVETAFTSSGTIGSATLVMGFNTADRTTALDVDGLTTTGFTGTQASLATVGTKVLTKVGSTGAGALLGTTMTENGVFVVANSGHASHPFTAGKIRIRLRYYFP